MGEIQLNRGKVKMQSANIVAAEFNVSVKKLRRILKNALELEIVSDKVSSTDLINTIEHLNNENSIYPISDAIKEVLIDQYNELQNLVSLREVAREHYVKERAIISFIKGTLGGMKKALVAGYFQYNIFLKSGEPEVNRHNADKLMNVFFTDLAGRSRLTKSFQKVNGKMMSFNLLEEVKDEHSSRGHIIGFAKDINQRITPIVAYSKKNVIVFMPKINKVKGNEFLSPSQILDENRPPIEFMINLSEIQGGISKIENSALNVLIHALNNRPFSINSLRQRDNLIFIITTNSFRLNLDEYYPQQDELKQDQRVKRDLFGEISGAQMVEFLNAHLKSHASISCSKMNDSLVSVKSQLEKVTLFVDRDIKKELINEAIANHVTISMMMNQWLSVLKVILNKNDYLGAYQQVLEISKQLNEKEDNDREKRGA